jgi:hypothetical protein
MAPVSDSPRRSVPVPALLVGLVAGVFAALVLAARRDRRPAPEGAPIGRVGEPGPHWTVDERVLIHRSPGEIAQFLHDHGGLPGLDGGREGPAMDKISWDVPGEGHLEAEVHGLPGAGRTELHLRVAPEQGGARSAAQHAAAAVLGTSVKAQVREGLETLKRRLESVPPESPLGDAAGGAPGQER